jgi:hypothetical protein
MQKSAAACLALSMLAACATLRPPAPDDLRGCWIERDADGGAKTMRWFPEGDVWRGEAIHYPRGSTSRSTRLRLDWESGSWRICALEGDRAILQSCTRAWFGPALRAWTGAWAEIYVADSTLRIISLSDDFEATVFDGGRDGCD